MVIVIAVATALPEHRAALAQQLAATAIVSRTDPGCLTYSFYADVGNPDSFASIEQWESREDLDAHLQTSHVAELLGALSHMVSAPPVVTVYEVSSSSTL